MALQANWIVSLCVCVFVLREGEKEVGFGTFVDGKWERKQSWGPLIWRKESCSSGSVLCWWADCAQPGVIYCMCESNARDCNAISCAGLLLPSFPLSLLAPHRSCGFSIFFINLWTCFLQSFWDRVATEGSQEGAVGAFSDLGFSSTRFQAKNNYRCIWFCLSLSQFDSL